MSENTSNYVFTLVDDTGSHRINEDERMKLMTEIEHEDCEALERTEPCPIETLETVLGNGMTARVLRLTPQQLKHVPQRERRLMLMWTEQRIARLQEKLALLMRNTAPEPELPERLRAAGE